MTKFSIAWLPILIVLGCVGTDTEDRETVVWNMNVSGWGAGRPIEGATVSVENTENSEYITDANGDVAVEVVSEDYITANMVADGFPSTSFHDYIGDKNRYLTRKILSEEDLDNMNRLLGLEVDPSNAQIVAVHVLDCDPYSEYSDCSYPFEAFVSITAEYELAFVDDARGGLDYNGGTVSGFSRGNNIVDGAVMFKNVKAGALELVIDRPCIYEPTVEVTANTYIDITAYCPSE